MSEGIDVAADWYVVYCNINCEFRARMGLQEKGFPVYLPTLRKWVTCANRKKQVVRPLFTRYLFVSVDLAKNHFLEVRRTNGVEAVLCGTDGMPATVPGQLLKALWQTEQDGFFDETQAVLKAEPGSLVKIINGPFADFIGKLKSARGTSADILLEVLGGETLATVPLETLRKV